MTISDGAIQELLRRQESARRKDTARLILRELRTLSADQLKELLDMVKLYKQPTGVKQ